MSAAGSPKDTFNFTGKRVMITGAGSGIGQGLCVYFAKAGATIIGVSAPAFPVEATEKLVTALGVKFQGILADLCIPEEAAKVASAAGVVDVLVNCAGVSFLRPFLFATVDDFDKTFAVNVRATMLMSQQIARGMVVRGIKGSIINVSSQASSVALSEHAVYCASKGAVDQLTRVMALELGMHGIRVNAINPTVVLTDMGRMAWSDPAKSGPMLDAIPLNRFAEIEDVAGVVAFLASDAAGMVSGSCVAIDGGALCSRSSGVAWRDAAATKVLPEIEKLRAAGL